MKKYNIGISTIAWIYIITALLFACIYYKLYTIDKNYFNVAGDLKPALNKENKASLKVQLKELNNEGTNIRNTILENSVKLKMLKNFFSDSVFLYIKPGTALPNTIKIQEGGDKLFKFDAFTPYATTLYFYNPVYRNKNYEYTINISNRRARDLMTQQLAVECYLRVTDISDRKVLLNTSYLLSMLSKHGDVYYRDIHEAIIHDMISRIVTQNNEFKSRLLVIDRALVVVKRNLLKIDESLNYFDFLYFSVITQSSTGYGDILPNNRQIRIVVTGQILISIFLLSFALNRVIIKIGEKNKGK